MAHISTEQHAGGFQAAVVNSVQCITGRHLFERIIGAVADALQWEDVPRRCESLAQLTVELVKMLKYPARDPRWRFVLVLDAVDRQRDAPSTLLPALARLSEIVSAFGILPTLLICQKLTMYRLDPLPHLCFRRHLPPSRLPTNTCIRRSPIPALRQSRLRSHPLTHAARRHHGSHTARNHRPLDPVLRSGPRLPHKIRLPHTAFLPT